MKEEDLAKYFLEYLSDYDLYQEVNVGSGGSYIDIMAYKKPIFIAVEVKNTFSIKVIEQAFDNMRYANYSYVAIPYINGINFFSKYICEKFGIGILGYNKTTGYVSEILKPKFNRKIHKLKLKNFMKESVAGSIHNRVTPFKNTINQIVNKLRYNNGKMKINDVLNSIDYHYSSFSAAKNSIYQHCRNNVIKEFKAEKGYFVLNEE